MDGDCLSSVMLPSMKVRQKRLCHQSQRFPPVYADSNNFGVRMLAKLGWSVGKGLGKNENGIAEPISSRLKKDTEGVGFKGLRDDQWMQHDADFNDLLKRLNGEEAEPSDECSTDIDPKSELQSLEERSKKSRARVHYKKFTRGKDLSQVNEKDLANIFGKRSIADVNKPNESNESSRNESDENSQPQGPILGLTIVKSSVSMYEYFQEKMKQKKLSNGASENGTLAASVQEAAKDPADEEQLSADTEKRKVKKSRKNGHEVIDADVKQLTADTEMRKTKKIKKNNGEAEEPSPVSVEEDTVVEGVSHKKSKRKREKMEPTVEAVVEIPVEPESEVQVVKKKKKSKKQITEPDETCEVEQQEHVVDVPANDTEEPAKKKKKSKRSKIDTSLLTDDSREAATDNNVPETKETIAVDALEPVKKKKKSKKEKEKTDCGEDDTALKNTESTINGAEHDSDGKDNSSTEEQTTGVVLPASADLSECLQETEEEMTCRVKVDVLKYLDETRFAGSNFANIVGYRLTEDVKLVTKNKY